MCGGLFEDGCIVYLFSLILVVCILMIDDVCCFFGGDIIMVDMLFIDVSEWIDWYCIVLF